MKNFCYLELEDGDARLRALSLLCALLPPANRDMLMELLRFLNGLAQHADCNCEMPVAATEDQEVRLFKSHYAFVLVIVIGLERQ